MQEYLNTNKFKNPYPKEMAIPYVHVHVTNK